MFIFCFVCLRQKDLILPMASSRDDGSTAKVIRSQSFNPTASPAEMSANIMPKHKV